MSHVVSSFYCGAALNTSTGEYTKLSATLQTLI